MVRLSLGQGAKGAPLIQDQRLQAEGLRVYAYLLLPRKCLLELSTEPLEHVGFGHIILRLGLSLLKSANHD